MFNVRVKRELENVYRKYVDAIAREDFDRLQAVSVGVLPASTPPTMHQEAFCYLHSLVPDLTEMEFVIAMNEDAL